MKRIGLYAIFIIFPLIFSELSFAGSSITKTYFHVLDSFYKPNGRNKFGKNLVLFTSRYYIKEILKSNEKPDNIYWILPIEELKKEDVDLFLEYMRENFKDLDAKKSAEGMVISFGKVNLYIMLFENISMIDMERGDAIIDVDYFFRSYKSEIKTPKVESVINIFSAFKDLKWNIENLYLIKSLDINLPDWVQEYSFLVEKIYEYWIKNLFPKPLLALDLVDQALYYFGDYEQAYGLLKEVESHNRDNPYYFKRLFLASLRTYRDNDVLYAAKRAYELKREMIELYLEGADYLISKIEFYPAYVLLKEGLKLEPWNNRMREKIKMVIELGYNYYNNHGENEDLFEFFRQERERAR